MRRSSEVVAVAPGQGEAPSVRLRRDSAQTLHHQLAARLIEEIVGMRGGQRLPTEPESMANYGVSRTTVRRAVATLGERGLLDKRQGKGTFVNRREVRHSLDHLSPFFAVLANAGKASEGKLVDVAWVSGAAVPPELGGPETRVLAFRRLYLADDGPHALLHGRVAETYAQGIGHEELAEAPILPLLERKHDLILRRARYTIRSTAADAQLADLLRLPAGAPLLVLDRLTRTADGEPVEYMTHYLRPEVYELTVDLDEPALLPHFSTPLSSADIPG
jgi:GntR family transcriptional regulator